MHGLAPVGQQIVANKHTNDMRDARGEFYNTTGRIRPAQSRLSLAIEGATNLATKPGCGWCSCVAATPAAPRPAGVRPSQPLREASPPVAHADVPLRWCRI